MADPKRGLHEERPVEYWYTGLKETHQKLRIHIKMEKAEERNYNN